MERYFQISAVVASLICYLRRRTERLIFLASPDLLHSFNLDFHLSFAFDFDFGIGLAMESSSSGLSKYLNWTHAMRRRPTDRVFSCHGNIINKELHNSVLVFYAGWVSSRTLFGDDIGNDGLLVTNLISNPWGPIDWWSIQDRIKVILFIFIISQ